VTRNATTAHFVTVSCRLGGPATVYWWGYDHLNPATTWYFDGGLHMKRASYCANSRHYTIAGTQIRIADDAGIEDDPIQDVEAFWTPTGATCLGTMRHPELGFSGWCNGVKLPVCPTLDAVELGDAGQSPWLADGIQ
jgi:ADYC domain